MDYGVMRTLGMCACTGDPRAASFGSDGACYQGALVHEDPRKEYVQSVIPARLIDDKTIYFLNPCGSFTIGGPQSDAGTFPMFGNEKSALWLKK